MGDIDGAERLSLADRNDSGLSKRGEKDLSGMEGMVPMLKKVLGNAYDEKENPDGIVILGIADNSLCRAELVEFFTSPGRLVLQPQDLTYADSFFASKRVLKAIAGMYNTVPDGLYDEAGWTPPIKAVEPEHIMVGNGATEILEACFWDLCDAGDGVLLSEPYYNAFDEDLTMRAGIRIIPVAIPPPVAGTGSEAQEPRASFAIDAVSYYEKALQKARQDGIPVRAVLICNPHNPLGAVYPRETMVELARFAARNDLHLVVDEIYARSVFPTKAVPNPTQFDSILRIDVEREAGLHTSRVHIVSSASKDFSINGFRIGIFISQNNDKLITAMYANARFAQTASPAGQLFASLLNDRKYLHWFLAENRRRLTATFDRVSAFFEHHRIPYVPSNAGHFCMIDLRRFLEKEEAAPAAADGAVATDGSEVRQSARWANAKVMTPERKLTYNLIENGVMIAPGGQYHHPVPGWFRMTFSIMPKTLQVGLARIEKTLRLEAWIEQQDLVYF